jgi:hypothetical protein
MRSALHIPLLLPLVLAVEPVFAQPTASEAEQLQARIDAAFLQRIVTDSRSS